MPDIAMSGFWNGKMFCSLVNPHNSYCLQNDCGTISGLQGPQKTLKD